MAQSSHYSTVTVRCPVCNSPRDADLPRRRIDAAAAEATRLMGAGVRCAECGESFECYYF